MFLLRDLRFLFSTYYARKGSQTFFNRNYPQINQVRQSDHVGVTVFVSYFRGIEFDLVLNPKCVTNFDILGSLLWLTKLMFKWLLVRSH